MPSRIDTILERYGFKRSPETTWAVQGNAIIRHHVLELIAIDLEVEWLPPAIIRHERDECVVLVQGRMDSKLQWSFGEACIGQNYQVSGKQAGYPYAMAEKRGKDRVVYKFLGLADATEAEEMADKPATEQPDASKMSTADKLRHNIGRRATVEELNEYVGQPAIRNAIGGLGPEDLGSISNFIQERRKALSGGSNGVWDDVLTKAKTALSKAKNTEEVTSYYNLMVDQEFADAPAEIREAFRDLANSRSYQLQK